MNRKKDTATKSKKSREELRRQLARDLAAVFTNPETPVTIYNALGEALNDVFNALPSRHAHIDESEAYINMVLDATAKAEAEKGGRGRETSGTITPRLCRKRMV